MAGEILRLKLVLKLSSKIIYIIYISSFTYWLEIITYSPLYDMLLLLHNLGRLVGLEEVARSKPLI